MPTTRPLGLGIGIAPQAVENYCGSTYPGQYNSWMYEEVGINSITAYWVQNWKSNYTTMDRYLPRIENPVVDNYVHGSPPSPKPTNWDQYDVAIQDALNTRRFYGLFNEPVQGGFTAQQVATAFVNWRTRTKKLVNGVWTYTKFCGPAIYLNHTSGAYSMASGSTTRNFMDTLIANLNSAQMPDTWDIHIYAESATMFEDIWDQWKSWMTANNATKSTLRPTIMTEFGGWFNKGTQVQKDVLDKFAYILQNDNYLQAGAFYGIGAGYAQGHTNNDVYGWTTGSGGCYSMIGSGNDLSNHFYNVAYNTLGQRL